jgi:hypothetical protein
MTTYDLRMSLYSPRVLSGCRVILYYPRVILHHSRMVLYDSCIL